MKGFHATRSLRIAICLWVLSTAGLGADSGLKLEQRPAIKNDGVQVGTDTSKSLIRSKRAPARHVGAVMAILGTFDEAGVLPPETDSRANQLIRSLIQFQSVFMKSRVPAVQEYFFSALVARWDMQGKSVQDLFNEKGWTSESLEAVVDYSQAHPMWQDEQMQEAFRQYYLSPSDWTLVQEVFQAARQQFVAGSKDIHAVFANQRDRMARGEY